jgi:hypothetical protein
MKTKKLLVIGLMTLLGSSAVYAQQRQDSTQVDSVKIVLPKVVMDSTQVKDSLDKELIDVLKVNKADTLPLDTLKLDTLEIQDLEIKPIEIESDSIMSSQDLAELLGAEEIEADTIATDSVVVESPIIEADTTQVAQSTNPFAEAFKAFIQTGVDNQIKTDSLQANTTEVDLNIKIEEEILSDTTSVATDSVVVENNVDLDIPVDGENKDNEILEGLETNSTASDTTIVEDAVIEPVVVQDTAQTQSTNAFQDAFAAAIAEGIKSVDTSNVASDTVTTTEPEVIEVEKEEEIDTTHIDQEVDEAIIAGLPEDEKIEEVVTTEPEVIEVEKEEVIDTTDIDQEIDEAIIAGLPEDEVVEQAEEIVVDNTTEAEREIAQDDSDDSDELKVGDILISDISEETMVIIRELNEEQREQLRQKLLEELTIALTEEKIAELEGVKSEAEINELLASLEEESLNDRIARLAKEIKPEEEVADESLSLAEQLAKLQEEHEAAQKEIEELRAQQSEGTKTIICKIDDATGADKSLNEATSVMKDAFAAMGKIFEQQTTMFNNMMLANDKYFRGFMDVAFQQLNGNANYGQNYHPMSMMYSDMRNYLFQQEVRSSLQDMTYRLDGFNDSLQNIPLMYQPTLTPTYNFGGDVFMNGMGGMNQLQQLQLMNSQALGRTLTGGPAWNFNTLQPIING